MSSDDEVHPLSAESVSTFTDPISIGRRIFCAVTHGLRHQHVNTSTMVIGQFKDLLPNLAGPAELLVIYEKLLAQPMHVSNAELHQIIHMQLYVKRRNGHEKDKGGRHRFSIHSWVFAAQELLSIPRVMKDTGYCFRELEE